MSVDPQELQDAENAGRAAYEADRPITFNPFSAAQGSLTRSQANVWRRGWRRAQVEAEEAGRA